jgi:hypothetical protein
MKNYSIEIVRYSLETNMKGEKSIVLKQIKVLDSNGKYVKFAKHEKIFNHLHKFPVRFKDQSND